MTTDAWIDVKVFGHRNPIVSGLAMETNAYARSSYSGTSTHKDGCRAISRIGLGKGDTLLGPKQGDAKLTPSLPLLMYLRRSSTGSPLYLLRSFPFGTIPRWNNHVESGILRTTSTNFIDGFWGYLISIVAVRHRIYDTRISCLPL